VFFVGVAQTVFAIVPQRDLAGAVVNRNLTILNFAGMAIALILIVTSLVAAGNTSKFWLWVERLLMFVIAAACAIGQFVISMWLESVRVQIGKPIEEAAADDPLRMQFDVLHQYSVWVLTAAMIAALIGFFIIANRRYGSKAVKTDVYDFSKEFKV